MQRSIRKITAIGASAALLAAAGIGTANAAGGGADNGRSGRPPAPLRSTQLTTLADELGVTKAQLKAALEAVKPDKPRGRPGPAAVAQEIATALGADVDRVREIMEANRPARGTRPTEADRTKLTAALAEGLGMDQATVEAKLKSAHEARHAEFAAALAKELGLDADDVQTALESVKPKR